MINSLSRAWMNLAIVMLLVSGLLSLFITGAKIPGIKEMVGNPEVIRWCLVVHVNLATLVWFTAVPMSLLHLSTISKAYTSIISKVGFLFSLIGILFMISVLPGQNAKPILSNYIPVLGHSRYYWGIGIYLLGIFMNILSPRKEASDTAKKWPGLNECRFGFLVGSVYILLAIITLAKAFIDLNKIKLISDARLFEIGMWGGGHLIQHACATFLVCSWTILLSRTAGHALFKRSELFPIFAWMGLPIFVAPIFLYLDVTSDFYREGFTTLMRWGIAPPILYFLFLMFRRIPFRWDLLKDYRIISTYMSAWLLFLGFIFGAFIRGHDLRVPGHYHASIGAVTLSFMSLSFFLLAKFQDRRILQSTWAYGIGQTLFASGMFLAGSVGMARKTYGSENVITHWGQGLGLGIMALGGIAALIGGLYFALAILPNLKLKNEDSGR